MEAKSQNQSQSQLVSKNIIIHGKRTSIRLEPDLWEALSHISQLKKVNIHEVCSIIRDSYKNIKLTSAIRVYILNYYRKNFKIP